MAQQDEAIAKLNKGKKDETFNIHLILNNFREETPRGSQSQADGRFARRRRQGKSHKQDQAKARTKLG
jgi:hypothetical protein